MAWKMNLGGIDIDAALPDRIVEYIREQINKMSVSAPGVGFWLYLGEPHEEGSRVIYVPTGSPITFTRLANDPRELLYRFEHGTIEGSD